MWKPEAFGMNTANFIMMKFYDVKFSVCRKAFFAFDFSLFSSSSILFIGFDLGHYNEWIWMNFFEFNEVWDNMESETVKIGGVSFPKLFQKF